MSPSLSQITFGLSKASLSPGWDTSAGLHTDTWLGWMQTLDWFNPLNSETGSTAAGGASGTSFSAQQGSLGFSQLGSMVAKPGGSLLSLDWSADSQSATLALKAAWNSVKNVEVSSFDGASLTVRNFVDTWVHLDNAFDQKIVVEGAKRGEVTLGSGNDRVELGIDTNDTSAQGWTNAFVVDTGAGNDILVTRASSYNAAGGIYDGRWTTVLANLGDGDDDVYGGFASHELLNGGAGTDTYHLSGAMSSWNVSRLGDVTTLTDGVRTHVLTSFEKVVFSDGSVDLATPQGRPLADVYVSQIDTDHSLGFKISTTQDYTGVGGGLTNIGDVNGDGFDDVGVFTSQQDTYVVFGGRDIRGVDVSTLNDGTGAGYRIGSLGAGYALDSVGDVNGDGVGDLLVTAVNDTTNGSASGAAYVVFGKADTKAIDLDTIAAGDSSLGFKIVGPGPWSYIGTSVGGGGDVNGDGLADVTLGSPYGSNGFTDAGTAYVVFGKADGKQVDLLDIENATGSSGFKIVGTNSFDYTGASVDVTGDMNRDGRAEVVVSTNQGVYLVFGKADSGTVELADIATGSSNKGFVVDEVSLSKVSAAGDVNGDGREDFIVGEYQANTSYVVFGKEDGETIHASDLASGSSKHGFALTDNSGGYSLGNRVSTAGDVNGDGLDDLILSNSAGGVFVVFGKTDGGAVNVATLAADGKGFQIHTSGSSEIIDVSAAGDVNGDGFDDLLVGNPFTEDGHGAVYVVYGGAWHV